MLRNIVGVVLRVTELPPPILAIFSLLALVFGFVKDLYSPYVGPEWALALSIAGFVVGVSATIPFFLRDINIWQFFPPRYAAIKTLLTRLGAGDGWSKAIFVGPDGQAQIDAEMVLKEFSGLLEHLVFPAKDMTLQSIAGRINANAFSGSRWGLGADKKTKRNADLSARQPLSFAMIPAGDQFHGLCGVLPLNDISTTLYVQGQIPDDDLSGLALARSGETIGSILVLLIANDPAAPESTQTNMILSLLECCLIQLVLIALATPKQRSFHVIAGNSTRSIRQLFEALRLRHHPGYKNADQQHMYALDVVVRNRPAALRFLRATQPELVRLLGRAS